MRGRASGRVIAVHHRHSSGDTVRGILLIYLAVQLFKLALLLILPSYNRQTAESFKIRSLVLGIVGLGVAALFGLAAVLAGPAFIFFAVCAGVFAALGATHFILFGIESHKERQAEKQAAVDPAQQTNPAPGFPATVDNRPAAQNDAANCPAANTAAAENTAQPRPA
ncbi:MAG: hypothetical protein V4490_02545 [Pseudomonadota bacterium]